MIGPQSRQDGMRRYHKKKRMPRNGTGLIVTDYRTGGTFLSLALDSHPRIYCCRDEPLSRSSAWYRYMDHPNPATILRIVLDQGLADICMCKVVYRQMKPAVWDLVSSLKPKIVHLIRENTLRAECSLYLNDQVRTGVVDRGDSGRSLRMWSSASGRKTPKPISLPSRRLLSRMRARESLRERREKRLRRLNLFVFEIKYEDLVGGEGREITRVPEPLAKELCAFLKVDLYPLFSVTKKVNAYPLSVLVENWDDVRKALEKTEFAKWLVEEERWKLVDGNWMVG